MPVFVSILLPFYNAMDTLPACLDSIQAQTHPYWELIAVNDHSTDGSDNWLYKQARRDQRIHMLNNPAKGLVAALNYGLSSCNHELVVRMDADDIMYPRRLSHQLRHFDSSPGLALSSTRVRLFPDELLQAGNREYLRWQNDCCSQRDIANQIYIESPFAHPSVCFRKSVVEKLGAYREGLFPEDYDLWLRLFHSCHVMEKIPEVLLDWRDSPNRVSRTDPRCSREAFDRLKAWHLAQDNRLLRHKNNFVIWGAGRKTRKRCQFLLDQGFKPKAWVDIDPKKIGNRLQGIPVIEWQALAKDPGTYILVAVGNNGARTAIIEALLDMGFDWGSGFLPIT